MVGRDESIDGYALRNKAALQDLVATPRPGMILDRWPQKDVRMNLKIEGRQASRRHRMLLLGSQALFGGLVLSYAGYNVWSLGQHTAPAVAPLHGPLR